MIKNCKHCSAQYEITQEDLNFYDKISPEFNWIKCSVPVPTFCPTCRDQRRLSWRNERMLYKRRCSATEKNIISIYSSDKPYRVYSQEEWWSNKWDWVDSWIDFDFNKSFFDQFNQLFNKVPKMNMIWSNNQNSSYCNLVADNKDCYLIFESSNNENCLYSYWIQQCKNCVDSNFLHKCELCYECNDSFGCYLWFNLHSCNNCSESYFLKDCIWCKNCFWCVGLKNKEYYFLNKKYSKEDYQKKVSEIVSQWYSFLKDFWNEFDKHQTTFPKKYAKIQSSEDCTWDYIENSKDCHECYHAFDAEHCKYWEHVWRNAKYIMDASTAWRNAELIYESLNCWIDVYSILFSSQCWNSNNLFYSVNCHNISNCFWCTWLKNHNKYCILNKQYSKEEYEALIPKIIEHMKSTWEWWEFFPIKLSPFAYNEAVVQECFPLPKEEVLKNGWQWKDEDYSLPKVAKIIPAEKLPDNINDIPEDVLNWAIQCENTWKPFKIVPQELKFYRENGIPIPHLHPDERHAERMRLRNPRKLYNRTCDKCSKKIQTTHSSDIPETIYCEECYLKEVY